MMQLVVLIVCLFALTVSGSTVSWVLGFSGESCTQACGRVSGTCDHNYINAITSVGTFDNIISSTQELGKGGVLGTSSATYCTGGVNTWAFASAPAVSTYLAYEKAIDGEGGHNQLKYMCYFPSTPQGANCDTAYTVPASQRICACVV